MTKRIAVAVLALSAFSLACQARVEGDGSSQVGEAAALDQDTWARSRECSETADRLWSQLRRDYSDQAGPRITSATNHYNRADRRCYLKAVFHDPGGRDSKGALRPLYYHHLYDAIEWTELAVYTAARLDELVRDLFCRIARPADLGTLPAPCAEADRFIQSKMTG